MAFYEGSYYSKTLKMDQALCVIVPNEIAEDVPLKTLYLLHGFMGNHTQWMRFSSIERYASQKNIVVVMPDGRNSYYVNHQNGLRYFDAFDQDLMHHIETTFNVSKNRDDRFVAGLSMGGFGALYWGLSKPEKFSKVASLSGALNLKTIKSDMISVYPEAYVAMMLGDEPQALVDLIKDKAFIPELFIACGSDDFLIEDNRSFVNEMKQRNIKYSYFEEPGAHTWAYWDTWIQKVLEWL